MFRKSGVIYSTGGPQRFAEADSLVGGPARCQVNLLTSYLGAHLWLALLPLRSPFVRHNKRCSAETPDKLIEPKLTKVLFVLLTSDVAPVVLSYLSISDTTRLLTICKTLADAQGDFPWMLSVMRLHIAQVTRVSRISLVHCSRGGHLGLGRGFSAMARALLALPSSYEVSTPSDREDPDETRPCDALCGACNSKLRVTLAPGVCGTTGLQNAFDLSRHSWADPSATARIVCTSTSCPLQPHLLIQAEHCEGHDNTCETLSLRVCDFCNFRTQRCTSCALECDGCSSIICEGCCLLITQSDSQLCPNCSFRCGGCDDCFEREGCNSCSSCGEESGEEFCDQCWAGGMCCVCDETRCMDCAVFAECTQCGEQTCADCIRTSLCFECNDPVCPAPGCGAHFD